MKAADDAYVKALLKNGGATAKDAYANPATYNASFASANRTDVVSRFRSAEACVRWDALRCEARLYLKN